MEYDVKKALKDAKELIKNKDFSSALDTCKAILKHDKNNYLGWVLSAVSFQELGQSEKALTAFVKATELQPEQVTAWQGLAAFLEQERGKSVVTTDGGQQLQELLERLCLVYLKLESFLKSDNAKHSNILKKQCELYAILGQLDSCVSKANILLQSNDKEVTKFVARVLAPFLSQLDFETLQVLEKSLGDIVCSKDQEVDLPCREHYLLVALQLKQYVRAVTVASDILDFEPKNVKSMEAICVAFVEEKKIDVSMEKIGEITERLLAINPSNVHGLLAKGKWLLMSEKSLEAKQLLELLYNKEPNIRGPQLYLCDAYQQLHQWAKMENISRIGLNSTLSTEADKFSWRLKLIKSLLEQGADEHLKEVSNLIENAKDKAQESIPFRLLETLTLLRTNQLEKCKMSLDVLEGDEPFDEIAQLLLIKAEYLSKIGREDEAFELLHRACEDSQNVELLLSAVKILWIKPDQRPKSVAVLLNVIKLNRDIAEPYVLLGNFYGEHKQNPSSLQRAIRCLEKAFQLDPYQTTTSEKLLEFYRLVDDIPSALKLLEVVVQFNTKNRRWAWLQKGLLHLKMFQKEKKVFEKEKEAGRAIACLQNAMAIDSNDSCGWETLGEAYIARGSYNAALKAFQRAVELNPKSLYSSYQIATLKQIMGENSEAVEAFEALLDQTPDYLPALKGLAETVLSQAIEYQTDGFTGRVVDCCNKAIQLLVRASQLNPHVSCVWSLMGNICLLLRSIPEENFTLLQLPSLLVDENSIVTKKQVMELGPQFFLSALRILPDSAGLWHNLALSYQSCWKLEENVTYKSSALAAVKKAITLEPNEASHWDLLGLIADQPAVQQHAFIRALELSPNAPRTAATWTHLGALYMENGDLHLAHECFKQSQNIDPFHVAAWIGQGNIAERLSPSEAMDLFRHTATIGSGSPGQCEGAPSYAQWVINTLADPLAKQTAHYRYSIVQMHAVPAAIDSLVKYVALYPDDSCALNLLGLLFERQGLLTKAEEAFLQGIKCLSEDDSSNRTRIDKMKANLARLYTSLDRCDDATELYGTLQESELSSACGIALAHFKANRHAEAYVTYEAALHWLASDDEKRSHLLVAMAMAAFRRDFPDAEAAKLLLYESSQLQPPSVYSLLALGALGLLTDDETLTSAAFQELLPYQTEPRYVADISRLSSYQQLAAGNELQGQREIARNLHMLPNEAELWTLLATFKATVALQSSRTRQTDGLQVARWAEIAFDARRQSDLAVDHIFQPINLSQIISLISLGYLIAGQGATSLTTAQKAVHCNPHSAASWSVLLAAALPSLGGSATDSDQIHRLGWLKKLIEHLRRKCDVTAYSRLTPWLGHYERRLVTLLSQV